MADYYQEHLRKTTDPTVILKEKLERGMVVRLKYKKGKVVARYVILILHPKWPKTIDAKVHALSLNSIPPHQFSRLAQNYKEVLSESKNVRKLDLAVLEIDMPTKLFYTSEIKKYKDFKAGYRTFDLKKIGSLHAVNYDWGLYDNVASVAERKRLLEENKKPNENKL